MEQKPNIEKRSDEEKKKLERKRFIFSLIYSFVGLLILTGLIILTEYYALDPSKASALVYHYLLDGFGLSGILGLLFFVLTYVASKGAFDILSYSVQLLFNTCFRPNYKKNGFPKSFYDYKVKKGNEERKPFLALCCVSLLFIAIGLIFLIPYSYR